MTKRERRKLARLQLRDMGMFGAGVWVLAEQVSAGPAANPWLLGTALALMGGPAVVNSVARAIAARSSDTEQSPSPSVPPASPPSGSTGP